MGDGMKDRKTLCSRHAQWRKPSRCTKGLATRADTLTPRSLASGGGSCNVASGITITCGGLGARHHLEAWSAALGREDRRCAKRNALALANCKEPVVLRNIGSVEARNGISILISA